MVGPARGGMTARALSGTMLRLLAFAGLFLAVNLPLQPWLRQADAGSRPVAFAGSALVLLAALVAGGVMIRRHDRRIGALGLAWTGDSAGELVRGFGIGAGAILVAVLVMVAAGTLRYESDAGAAGALMGTLAGDFGLLAVAAMAEEALFRGYPFQLVAREFGPAFATIVTSVAFAAAHAGNPNVTGLALANIFLAGLLLSLAYLRTRSLWFATAVHLGWNWTVAVAADLPVSGIEFFDTPAYEPVLTGPAWLTGGAFGPEGGLAVTIATGLAILVVVRWPRVTETPGMRALRPLVDGCENGERVVHGC